MLSPPFPDEIKRIYVKLRERGCTRRDACRICDLTESTVRVQEKTDLVLAKAEQAAVEGRAGVTAFVCEKAVEALDDPHGRNTIHWARWLLKVYSSPLPLPGDDDGHTTGGDDRVIVNIVQVVRALDERRAKMIESNTKALPHEQETPHLVDIDGAAEPVGSRRGNGRAASA